MTTNRLQPYRKRCPENLIPIIEEAIELKLYLVNEQGPTKFEFKQENEKKIKVQIGQTINCSICKLNDHCVHSLYVLIKIFKRACNNDELLYQQSYIDDEIQKLISSRYNSEQSQNKKKDFLKRNLLKPPIKGEKKELNRHDISQDQICSICHEDFNKDTPITFCQKKCGTNFHIECLKIWIHHKQKNGKSEANCPICRSEWDSNILIRLEQERRDFEDRFLIHKVKCQNCGKKPIKGNIYKCIFCSDYYICQSCFPNLIHEHKSFLLKKRNDSEYEAVTHDSRRIIKTEVLREVFNSHRVIKDEIIQFLIDSFPYKNDINNYSPQNQFNNQKIDLQIIGIDAKKNHDVCGRCKKPQRNLKKLNCGHLIDYKCLEQIISSENIQTKLKCPIDDQIICQGYYQVIKNQLKQMIVQQTDKQPRMVSSQKRTKSNHKHKLTTTSPSLPQINSMNLAIGSSKMTVQNIFIQNKKQNKMKKYKPPPIYDTFADLAVQGVNRGIY